MKILVLVTDAFGGLGGIAKFNRDLLTALCRSPGVSSVVAVPRVMTNDPEEMPPNLRYVTSGLGGKLRYTAALTRALLEDRDVDLVICGHIYLLPLCILCRALLNAPLVLVVHGTDAWEPTPKRVANIMAKRVDGFVAVSDVTKKRFISWTHLPKEKGVVLPNCFDAGRFEPGPPDPELIARYGLAGRMVIMTLGRLNAAERAKGFDEIIDVMPVLLRSVPDLVYMVVGDGDDRERLTAKVRSLGLRENVVFTGYVPESEKAAHYRLADAYVMPSRGEGFGIVYLEALACGLPVVGSKIDGSRDAMLGGRLGILVNPDDPEDIVSGVLQALDRPKVVPADVAQFSFQDFQRRVDNLFEKFRLKRPVSLT